VSAQLQQSSSDFESLNEQLLTELPIFLSYTEEYFTAITHNLVRLQSDFQKQFFNDVMSKDIVSKITYREMKKITSYISGQDERRLSIAPVKVSYQHSCLRNQLNELIAGITIIVTTNAERSGKRVINISFKKQHETFEIL
jgi:hypothetical protein